MGASLSSTLHGDAADGVANLEKREGNKNVQWNEVSGLHAATENKENTHLLRTLLPREVLA